MIYVEGVCVGLVDKTIPYTNKEGKQDSFRVLGCSFADPECKGEPIDVSLDPKDVGYFKPFKAYRVPIEARAYVNKSGGVQCRYVVVEGAVIEPITIAPLANQPQPVKS